MPNKKLNKKTINLVGKIKKPKKKNNKRKKILYVSLAFFISLIFLISLAFAYYYPVVKNLYLKATFAKEQLIKTQDYVKKQDFSKANETLLNSKKAFTETQEEYTKLGYLKYIPIFSRQYLTIEKIIFIGIDLTIEMEKLMDFAIRIVEPLKKDSKISLNIIDQEQKREILEEVFNSVDLFNQVGRNIDEINTKVNNISVKGLIGPLPEIVRLLKDEIPKIHSMVEETVELVNFFPQVVGFPQEKTYLFLLENNTELRPTGGFIGTYGVLKVKDGEITKFETDNVYNLDDQAENLNVKPPWPLTQYNKVEKWYLRDSNWSPDFPTAAEKALWFYNLEGGKEKNLDGVIAITPTFIESLIELTGSIMVHGVEFTTNNFVDTLQYQVEKGFYQRNIEESQRKEIIGDLSKIIIERIFDLPQERWEELFKILDKDLKSKHILIYLKDGDLQRSILAENWGGHVRQVNEDYFFLVDANLASLKSDPGVKRTITYQLTEINNRLKARLEVKYNNEGTFTWKTTRYRTFFRLYVPHNSELIDIKGTNEDKGKVDELGKTYFSSFISIEPQEEKTVVFEYFLPKDIYNSIKKDQRYSLLVQKQPGAQNYTLNLNFTFENKIKNFLTIDKVIDEEDNKLSFNDSLSKDLEYIITFK